MSTETIALITFYIGMAIGAGLGASAVHILRLNDPTSK